MGLVNLLCAGWSGLVFLFLYIPIVLLVVYSFNASDLISIWGGFSTEWYVKLWNNGPLIDATKNSLIIAAFTTVFSVILGTLGAWLLYRYKFPALRPLGTLIFIPMVIPEVIMGVSLLILFTVVSVPLNQWLATFTEAEVAQGFATIIIAHTTFCFPFVLVAVQARLTGVDPFLEEAAMDLGAPPLKAFWLVMVPYLLPAIVSGALSTLEAGFGRTIPAPAATAVTHWTRDPYAGGSYTFLPVGASRDDVEALAQPEGDRLLFAGEGTYWRYYGNVHAAVLSGLREAERLGVGTPATAGLEAW